MTDTQARARVWTLCLATLVLAALTGPVALLTPLAHASSPALRVVAALLAVALVGAYVALAVLLIAAVLRVVRLYTAIGPRVVIVTPPALRDDNGSPPAPIALKFTPPVGIPPQKPCLSLP